MRAARVNECNRLFAVDKDGGPVSPRLHPRSLPLDMAQAWVGSDQVSLSLDHAEGSGPTLLIEEIFQCLHGDRTNPNDDADAFPNPSAGQRRERL